MPQTYVGHGGKFPSRSLKNSIFVKLLAPYKDNELTGFDFMLSEHVLDAFTIVREQIKEWSEMHDPTEQLADLQGDAHSFCACLIWLGLNDVAEDVRTFINVPSQMTAPVMRHYAMALDARITLELHGERARLLSQEELNWFKKEFPFGEQFVKRFPSQRSEAQEAYKCMALGRYVACVFLTMRTIEFCVQKLATAANVPLYVSGTPQNWHNLLRDVDRKLTKFRPGDRKEDEFRANLSEAIAGLQTLRPRRNAVSHPKGTYSQKQASKILRIAEDFVDEVIPLLRPVKKHLAGIVL